MKHSPAPFRYAVVESPMCLGRYEFILRDADEEIIAYVHADSKCARDNIQLFKGAPEMLEALKELYSLHEPEGRFQPSHYKPTLSRALKAIASAEGFVPQEAMKHAEEAYTITQQRDALLSMVEEMLLDRIKPDPYHSTEQIEAAARRVVNWCNRSTPV